MNYEDELWKRPGWESAGGFFLSENTIAIGRGQLLVVES